MNDLDKENKWERFIVREEFFKLYFENFAISEYINIERLTDLYDITRNKLNSVCHFAIIRYKLNPEITDPDSNFDQFRRMKNQVTNPNSNDLFLMFPSDNQKYDDSINFLSLALSGMANINEKQSKLFIKDEDDNIYLKTIFNEIKYKKNSPISPDYKEEINDHDNSLKNNNEFRLKHNKTVKSILGGHIENIPPIKKDKNSHFSLFLLKDSIMYEFTAHDMMIREVKKNITNQTFRSTIVEEILLTGENSYIQYQNDISIFSEVSEQVNNDLNINSEGSIIITLISVIFIVNFFQTFPQKYLYEFSKTTQEFLQIDHITNENYFSKIHNLEEAINHFADFVIPSLYNNKTYYQNIKNKFNKAQSNSTSSNLTKLKIEFNPAKYYPFNLNIYSGCLVSFKRISGQSDGDIYRMNTSIGFYEPVFIQNTTDFSLFSYDTTTNPMIGGSYNQFLKPYLKTNKINYQRDLIKNLVDPSVYLFSYTIILYNANINTAIVYSANFEFSPLSKFNVKVFTQCFMPFVQNDKKTFVMLIVLNIIYLIGFIYIVFIVVRTFSHHIVELIKSRKYSFEWHDWVDLIVLIICFSSQIMFYKLYLFLPYTFPIQIGDPQTFNTWLTYAMDTKDYNSITGLSIFFITIRLIRMLYTSFPNFGIVFQTLSLASNEIIAYILLLISLTFGITMVSYVNFGWYSDYFRYLGDTVINIFMMLTGNFDYSSISNDNRESKITPYFYIFFMFFYNLILINVFLLTIRNNYADVKEKDQKFNEAYALMIAEKSLEFQNKLLHFLLCGDPVIEEGKNKNEHSKDSKQNLMNIKDEEDEIQAKKERDKNIAKLPIWTKMQINFERLNIKNIIFGGNAWTREEFEINKKRKYKEIELGSLISSIEDLEVDYEKEFDQLSDTVVYIFYMIIMITVLFIQIQTSLSASFNNNMYHLINKKLANFSEIIRFEQTNKTMNSFFRNAFKLNDSNLRNPNITFDPFLIPGYVFLQPPYFRLTFRMLSYSSSPNNFNTYYFPNVLNRQFVTLDNEECGSDIEEKTYLIGPYNKTEYKYLAADLQSKNDDTPFNCGGYVYLVNTSNPFANKNSDLNIDTYIDTFFKDSIGSVVLDFVVTNIHYHTKIYIIIIARLSCVGITYLDHSILSIPINLYSHQEDFTRLLFELVYVFFFCYYAFILTESILIYLKKYLKIDFDKDPEKEKFRNSNLFNKYMRIDFKSRENDGITTALLFFLWKFVERSISFLFYLLNSFLDYTKESVYNILELVTFIFSITGIGMWIRVIQLTSKLNLKFIDKDLPIHSSTKPDSYFISDIEDLKIYFQTYTSFLSITLFVYMFKTIKFFRFSKSIYNLVKIIDLAKNTIIFHMIFIAVLYLGFAIWGVALFGQHIYNFSTLSNSFIELWIILGGDTDYMNYVKVDNIWACIFVTTYIFLNTLILFNILNAIVIETYKEIKHRQEQNSAENEEKNFLENVMAIINNKFNIFIYTVKEYHQILVKMYNELILNYIKQLEEGLNHNDSNLGNNTKVSSIDNYISVFSAFAEIVNSKIYHLERIALRMLPPETMYKDLDTLDEQKLMDEYKAQMKNKLPKITKYDNISIWVKIFTYIINCIHTDQIEHNIEMGRNPQMNLFNIEDLTIYLEEKSIKRNKKDQIGKTNNLRSDKKSNSRRNTKVVKDENINKFHKSLKKSFDETWEKTNHVGFFKKKLFDKEKKLRLNKKARNNIAFYNSHDQYYHFEVPKKNRLYNIDFILNCSSHANNKKYDFSCKDCYENFSYFYNIYVIVYDLLVKYFYLPDKISIQEKELYMGYYLCKILENKETEDLRFNNKIIFDYKIEKFLSELEALLKMDEISIDKEFFLKLEKMGEKVKSESKFRRKKQEELYLNDSFYKLKNLYKKFVIWNSLYLILLEKYPFFVKEIKENSLSNKIIIEKRTKFEKEKHFIEYFKSMFNLNDGSDLKVGKIDAIYIKQKLREYGAKTQMKIESFDISNKSFYEKGDKFLIDDEEINNIDDNIPKKEYIDTSIKYKLSEFDLLLKMWNSWKSKNTINDQFYIFFGYNKLKLLKIDCLKLSTM